MRGSAAGEGGRWLTPGQGWGRLQGPGVLLHVQARRAARACTREGRLRVGGAFARGIRVCTRDAFASRGCVHKGGTFARGKCICTRDAIASRGCMHEGRASARGVCMPREVYLHGEVKQGSALMHPSDVGVQRAPGDAGRVLGAGTWALVSTDPALTHRLMDAGWHCAARHGGCLAVGHHGCRLEPGRGECAGAPQGCRWLCGVTLCPPTTQHRVGIRGAARGTPHPWSWARWGAQGTHGCSAPMWFGTGLQDDSIKHCSPGGKAGRGPALRGQHLGDVGALFLLCPAAASPAPSPPSASILIHHRRRGLLPGTALPSASLHLFLFPAFCLPGKKRENEMRGERGGERQPRWGDGTLGGPAPGRDLASSVHLPLPRHLPWGSCRKAVIKSPTCVLSA